MENLTFEQSREMLLAVADRVMASKELLTEIDSRIGDGDHGIGMYNGMSKAKAVLGALPAGDNVYALFSEMGKAMLMSMGGASGVIFGTMFMGGAKKIQPAPTLNAQGLAELLRLSLAAIKERGKAEPGDKTMVDALEPAVEAMLADSGEGLEKALAAGAAAAAQGAEATKNYTAKFGRAKSLMERAVGYQDAGATSTAIILQAMHDYVAGINQEA